MLPSEHNTAVGVIKMNCRPIETNELKKFDKSEKYLGFALSNKAKGMNI